MPLNSEQREAVRLIKEWELINTDRYFILDGAAGVGKTYTLSQIRKNIALHYSKQSQIGRAHV